VEVGPEGNLQYSPIKLYLASECDFDGGQHMFINLPPSQGILTFHSFSKAALRQVLEQMQIPGWQLNYTTLKKRMEQNTLNSHPYAWRWSSMAS